MKNDKLEALATECVGDDKTDLFFVSKNSEIRAVFVIAKDAEKYARDNACDLIESKRGCFSPEEFIRENF